MGKPGAKAYSIINDLLKKGSPFRQQKLNKRGTGVKLNKPVIGKQNTTPGQRMGPGSKLNKENKIDR
tara:strand:+ start:22 stop:222 length:201 start_codon:yes stop_codon:yes gene_type:complete